MEQARPGRHLQRIEDRIARIAEPAGEFERPDALPVYDGIEIDVAAIAAFAQQWLHASEREVMKALRALIGDNRAHFAGQFAQIAGKETLVLPIETGGLQECLAIEIRPDADFDALDMLHQY